MKMIKSLILGSAAGLVAMSGAQAADLPVKAKAVEYVRICSLYGAGFYYIPGTDTCIKLGGYLRVDMCVNTNSDRQRQHQSAPPVRRTVSPTPSPGARVKTSTSIPAPRPNTAWSAPSSMRSSPGPMTPMPATGNGSGSGLRPIRRSAARRSRPGQRGSRRSRRPARSASYYAFIQFAGFTMGKAVSQFSAPWANYPGNNFDGLVGGGGTVTGVNQFTYTAEFGNGVSGTVVGAGSDRLLSGWRQQQRCRSFRRSRPPAATGTSDYAGTVAPDIVGNSGSTRLGVLFQVSVAAHDNHVAYYGNTIAPCQRYRTFTGHPDDKWGWLFSWPCRSRTSRPDLATRSTSGRLYRWCNPLQHPGPGISGRGLVELSGGTGLSLAAPRSESLAWCSSGRRVQFA